MARPRTKTADAADQATPGAVVRVLKKYPNLRLYDTQSSSYITLADVKRMVLEGEDFEVRDAKSGEDLTRSILLQIILEEETAGAPMFSTDMLQQIIRFYGQALQAPLQDLMARNLEEVTELQQQFAKGGPSFNPEQWSQFLQGQALDPEVYRENAEKALLLVQTFDPAGVGARDLRECLLIQLKFFGFGETPAATIVESHMRMLEMRDVAGLVRVRQRPEAEILDWLDLIEGLDPRPGSTLSAKPPSYVVPDVMIYKKDGAFVVELNDDSLPLLRISSSYRQFLNAGSKADDEAKTYVRDKMRSALFLIKSVDQRQRTLYKVADSILKRQEAFFEQGVSALKPMVLRDVADDISMHESTVSRIVQNKHAHTPQGALPLKYFFHSGLKGESGESVSSVAIKEKIRNMIDAETPGKPLSDAQIGQVLSYQGTTIARRTVAKYREEMRIPSSSERKGRPRLRRPRPPASRWRRC